MPGIDYCGLMPDYFAVDKEVKKKLLEPMRVGWLPGLLLALALSETRLQTFAAPVGTELRRDQTVRAVERAMPSVVNISGKTVVRRKGYLYDWWRNNWAPFYQDMPPQYSAGSGVIIFKVMCRPMGS